MVLYIVKWDIHPDKTDTYLEWHKQAIASALAVSGVVELRVFRGAAGAPQVMASFEFADMAAWAAWHSSENVQKVLFELHMFAVNVTIELWGPSPTTPQPIRPGG